MKSVCIPADEKCLYTLDEYFKDLNNEIYYLPCYNNLKYIKDLSEKKGAKRCLKKRRDNRNHILRTGESQRKDGRYAYKYTNNLGKIQFVYAWKLVPTDRTPNGKKDDISLREKSYK